MRTSTLRSLTSAAAKAGSLPAQDTVSLYKMGLAGAIRVILKAGILTKPEVAKILKS